MVRTVSLLVVLVAAVVAAAVALALPSGPATAPSATETPSPDDGRLVLLVLGDSIGTGAGASTTYADELASRLPQRVAVRNLARNGWTTSDMLSALRGDELFRDAVAGADLVTWSIGGNDLLAARRSYVEGTCGGADGMDCVRAAVAQTQERWDAIADEIVALSPSGSTLATMDLYDPFAGAGVTAGDVEALAAHLAAVNTSIAGAAAARGIALAPVSDAFNGQEGDADAAAAGLLAEDGIHPSDAGHERIAEALSDVLAR